MNTAASQLTKRGKGRKGLLRPDLHLTRIAKDLGVSTSHISQILRGRKRPSFDLAFRLAEALGFCSVEQLREWLDFYKQQTEAWQRMEVKTEEIWKMNVPEKVEENIPACLQP